MSIGGSSGLGTLLVQRLDAVLGTTLSQQANLATGARPDAVSQPAVAERNEAAQNRSGSEPREAADKALAQAERQAEQRVARQPADQALAALVARDALRSDATRSAPTTLGRAAQAILALLDAHPGTPGPIHGRRPLLPGALAMALTAANQQPAGQEDSAMRTTDTGRHSGPSPSGQSPASSAAGGTDAKATATRAALPAPGAGGTPGSPASPVQPGAPLAASTAAQALSAALAQALSRSVQESGLFYESHLGELAFGRRSIESVRAEPQAQAGQTASMPSGASQGSNTTPATPAGHASGPSSAAPTHAPAPAHGALATMDPQTHMLVRQQLEVLAHQHIAWQGEAWPGAAMEYRIGRRHESAQDGDDGSAPARWATHLRLSLPELGEVEAEISLAGNQLALHVDAPQSCELLREQAEGLRNRLGGQGLDLGRFSVSASGLDDAPQADMPESAP